VHDFPVELIPEYVDRKSIFSMRACRIADDLDCLAQGLGITGTISNVALGMKLQRHIQMAGITPSV
jgi:hypothetical protein